MNYYPLCRAISLNHQYQTLESIITHKWHFQIQILRDIFKELPLICYRNGKSLKYVLVKAKQRL